VTCTAMSMTPLCKYDTAVTLILIFEWLWLSLKKTSIEKNMHRQIDYTISITFTHTNMGVNTGSFFVTTLSLSTLCGKCVKCNKIIYESTVYNQNTLFPKIEIKKNLTEGKCAISRAGHSLLFPLFPLFAIATPLLFRKLQ
jgi:hypothetical protein